MAHEIKNTMARADAAEKTASEFQGKLAAMLEDKATLLAQKAELENRSEQLGLERDRAARACEAAIGRLTENVVLTGNVVLTLTYANWHVDQDGVHSCPCR